MRRLFQDRWYVVIIMLVLLGTEYLLYHMISVGYCHVSTGERLALYINLLIAVPLCLYGLTNKHFHTPTAQLFGRFLENSLKGTPVVLITVLMFMMQLSWFMDYLSDAISCFDDVSSKDQVKALLRAAVPFLGMLITVFLFPYPDEVRGKLKDRTLLLTSLSVSKKNPDVGGYVISQLNFELINKTITEDVYDSSESFEPLGKLDELKNIFIIPSNEVMSAEISEELGNGNTTLLNDIRKYNNINKSDLEARRKELADIFTKLLQKTVVLSKPVNYNNLSDVCETAQQVLKEHENSTNETLLYISPGTNISGSALAILSIVGGRMVLYQEQFVPNAKLVCIYPSVDTLASWYKDFQKYTQA